VKKNKIWQKNKTKMQNKLFLRDKLSNTVGDKALDFKSIDDVIVLNKKERKRIFRRNKAMNFLLNTLCK
jgi:hypothetical protein